MKQAVFILFIVITSIAKQARAQITFQKTYSSLGDLILANQSFAKDGSCLMVGTTNGTSGGDAVFTGKTDSAGVGQWLSSANIFGTDEQGYNIAATKDGGAIVTGFYDGDVNGQKALLMKLNASGAWQWSTAYGIKSSIGWFNETGYYVLQTADNGYLVAGATIAGLYLFKTDSNGTQQWTRVINGVSALGLQQTSDGNYIVQGFLGSGSTAKTYLCKISHGGSILWEKYITNAGGCVKNSLKETTDKGFIMCGRIANTACLLKTDSVGNYQWAKGYTWLNKLSIASVIQTKDGGFAFAGGDSAAKNMLLFKTASDGSPQWGKAYGDSTIASAFYSYTVLQTHNNGYVIGGIINNTDCYVVKTDSLGNSHCKEFPISTSVSTLTVATTLSLPNIDTLGKDTVIGLGGPSGSGDFSTVICYQVAGINNLAQENSVNVYPNPATSSIQVSLAGNSENNTLILTDMLGNTVKQMPFNTPHITLNITDLSEGIYNLSISGKEGVVNKRVVITHP